MELMKHIRERQGFLSGIRRDIHAYPELAFSEFRTADLVATRLEQLGIETHRGIGGTGVLGVLRNGNSEAEGGPAIGLRADMDALPITERNTFAHHSRHVGRMHACGHDGHTTMLLGAAEFLSVRRNFAGTVYLIFQPAEEGEGGARAMLEDGLLERFPMDAVFGMHNWPGLPAGSFAVHEGPVMACADRFDIEIRGRGCHAAMPHLGVDPVVAGAALVQAVQAIASRTVDPLDAVVVSVAQFHAGEAYNVIPDRAILSGTVRAFRPEVEAQVEEALQRICAGIGTVFGAEASLEFRRGYPPTVNTPAEAAFCAETARVVAGADKVAMTERPSMGAEDFAYFLQERPGAYVWIGNGPGEGGCTLHNPHYDFNDEIITIGTAYWVRLAERWLARDAAS
jgi:hippurate hydrolase